MKMPILFTSWIFPCWIYDKIGVFPYALLIGIAINPYFIKTVHDSSDYVHTLSDEYAQAEKRVGMIADKLAGRLISKRLQSIVTV